MPEPQPGSRDNGLTTAAVKPPADDLHAWARNEAAYDTLEGIPYIAHETRAFGRSLGMLVCNTPAYSPESNGMAEAFVKSFKRDYVYVHRLDDAASVMQQLEGWFDDYNEGHPHRGLKMLSPREYRRLQSTA